MRRHFHQDEVHTNDCLRLLPKKYRGRFGRMARVMERASILWAIFVSPLIWTFLNRHYLFAFDADERCIYLFRVPMGFFGVGQATDVLKFPLEEVEDLRHCTGLISDRIKFRTSDGIKMNLFVPGPSTNNAKAVFEDIQHEQQREPLAIEAW